MNCAIRSRRRTGALACIPRIRSGTGRQQPAVRFRKRHTFSPTMFNEVNVGFARFRRERHSLDAFTRNWIQELGIKGFSTDPLTWAAPSMTPTGYPEIGYSSNNAVFKWVTSSAQIVDNFAVVRGAHTVKAGGTIQFKRLTTVQWGQPDGRIRSPASSALPCPFRPHRGSMRWPICFSDTHRRSTVQTTPFSPHLSYTQMGYYLQDDWRMTDNLTANVGLRWEYFGRPVERDNRMASFDLATGQQVFPGQNGYPRSLVDPYYKDFAPKDRPGLARRQIARRSAVDTGFSTLRMSSTRTGNLRFRHRSETSAA